MSYQYPILVAVMGQRLWELFISRRRLEADSREGTAELIPEPAYPLIVAVHAAWIAGCWLEVLAFDRTFQPWLVLPAMAVWGLSLGLRVWMMAAMGRWWNVRLIARQEQEVVVAGPYRFIRHPNYLALILEIAAIPLLLGAYWTALLASVANGLVLWARIRKEEAYLDTWEEYQAAFGGKKRLIPGVF